MRLWGDVDAATQEHGLAVTGGRVSTTGVGGLTLGSGSGWLERKLGFVCDNLLSAQVVTADGDVVIASDDENPDLFWGLRGGGGNFGVVTRFDFRLHPIGPIVFGGMLMYPAAMAGELVRFYRDFMAKAPDEVGTGLAFITAPPEDFVPEPVRGQPVIGIVCCYAGPVEEGEEAFRPLRELALPRRGHGPADALRRRAAAARPAEPQGHAELLDRRLLRGAARRGGGHARRHRDEAGLADDPDHPRAGRRCRRPGRRGRHRLRAAQRAVEHPLPLDVARPRRHRHEHRLHASSWPAR